MTRFLGVSVDVWTTCLLAFGFIGSVFLPDAIRYVHDRLTHPSKPAE